MNNILKFKLIEVEARITKDLDWEKSLQEWGDNRQRV